VKKPPPTANSRGDHPGGKSGGHARAPEDSFASTHHRSSFFSLPVRGSTKPDLIVVISIDQFPYSYIERFQPYFGAGGSTVCCTAVRTS
jgi:hypothetical protein